MAAFLTAVFLTVVLWGTWWVLLIWVLAYPFAMFLGFATGVYLQGTGQIPAPDETQENIWVDENSEMIVGHSEETIGTFNGEPIHEWVDLKRPDNGEIIRCYYDGTMRDDDDDLLVPEGTWFCVVPAGIVYVARS